MHIPKCQDLYGKFSEILMNLIILIHNECYTFIQHITQKNIFCDDNEVFVVYKFGLSPCSPSSPSPTILLFN